MIACITGVGFNSQAATQGTTSRYTSNFTSIGRSHQRSRHFQPPKEKEFSRCRQSEPTQECLDHN